MATYTRLGSYLLAGELTNDPIGRVHRGIVLVGDKFDHHVLVRSFFEELHQAGLGKTLPDAAKNVPLLGGSKAFGVGYRFEGGNHPFVVCDYVPGRSLAQLLEKAKHDQFPFGVDHALSVLQGIAQSLLQLHGKGLTHGLLSPHSVWVSFEGAAQILDAPYAGQLRGLLPKSPVTQTSLEAYVRDGGMAPLQQDLFSLGAILYEMLTLERLPQANLGSTLVAAKLHAAQEDAPIPAEILSLIQRLVGVGQPFGTAQEFNAEMERVLYDGDYSPTTFNMAFFMHSLFREENDADGQGMKTEASDDYSAYVMVAAEAAAGGRQREPIVAGETEAQKSKKLLYLGAGLGIPAVLILGFLAFRPRGESEEVKAMRMQLAEMQRKQVEADMERSTQAAKAQEAQDAQKRLAALKAQATNIAEAEKIQRQIDEEQRKEREALKQKAEAEARARQQEQAAKQVAQTLQIPAPPKPEPKPEPKPAAPTPAAPTPAAQAPAPAPAPAQAQAQGQPQMPPPVPTAPTQARAVQEVAVQVVSKVAPVYPARAKLVPMFRNQAKEVQVKVFVDAAGRPQKVTIVQGVEGEYGFNEAAQKAALDSTYQAATRDGKPVSGWVTLNFMFKQR